MNKKTGMWFIGGLVALILGMALCMPGGGCEGGPGGGPGPGGIPGGGPEGGPEEGDGPGMGPSGPRGPRDGIGPGPGADRIGGGGSSGIPDVPERPGVPEYEVFSVPGESIPLGCAPVTVTPREEKRVPEKKTERREPSVAAGDVKGTYGAIIKGNPSTQQMQITKTALGKIEEKYPGIADGRNIFIYQSQSALIRALQEDGDRDAGRGGGPNAATSLDGRRIFIGPKTFEGGADMAIYIVAHEFGHVNIIRQGRRLGNTQHEIEADRFATDLLGYSFPSGVTKAAMAGGGTGEGGRRGGRGRGGRGMMGGVVMENPEMEATT